MPKFTQEEIELLEEQFDCWGFEKAIMENYNDVVSVISSNTEFSDLLLNIQNAHKEYENCLRLLSDALRKEEIETCY